MANPAHLAVFATVVKTGSISAAAKQLGCGKSVVSRQLAKLEEELGARLLQRSTRRLALTEIGQMVLQEAQQIERALHNIDHLSEQFQQEVCGLLRVSCSVAGRAKMVPIIAAFMARYPKVSVNLQLEDHIVDLIANQIDVAIRAAHLADSSLVARKLTDNHNLLVAAPAYLARAGQPTHPQDLRTHACLVYTQGMRAWNEWNLGGPGGPYKVQVNSALQINDGGALVNAALLGCGILSAGRLLVRDYLETGELQQVLVDYPSLASAPIYAVYPARQGLALKTSCFVQFLVEYFVA
ncbi:MAG: LysR family transcriptional regulator [Burkholderiales bacterium]|nr:LysR family transcriptional regulator [Burkholderiales bacterium]